MQLISPGSAARCAAHGLTKPGELEEPGEVGICRYLNMNTRKVTHLLDICFHFLNIDADGSALQKYIAAIPDHKR